MEKSKSYNYVLSGIQGIACIAIVFLHCSTYPGIPGNVVNVCSRFAVPLFYFVSGFYLFAPVMDCQRQKVRVRKKIVHVFSIAVLSSLLYVLYQFASRRLLNGDSLIGMAMEYFGLRENVMWLLFNKVSYAGHLWFVYGLLYAYLAVYGLLCIRQSWAKWILTCNWLPVALFISGIALRFCAYFSSAEIWYYSIADVIFYRNWFFTSLPCVLFGYVLRRRTEAMAKIRNSTLILLAVGGLLLSFAEWEGYLLLFHTYPDLYIGTLLFTAAIFVMAMNNPYWKKIIPWGKFVQPLFMPIYIIHPLISSLLHTVYTGLGGDTNSPVYLWGRPVFVLVLSAAISTLYINVKKSVLQRQMQ